MNLNNEIKTHLKIKLQNLGFLFSSEEKLDEFINSRIGISHSLFDENTYHVFLDDKELLFTVENSELPTHGIADGLGFRSQHSN